MFPKQKRKKKNSTSDATAMKWFSRYIRLRDRIPGTDLCRCISCSKVLHWKEMDCGHFVSRDRWNIRYNEMNAHAQCQECNRFANGQQYLHGVAIDRRYGDGTAKMLMSIGKRGGRFGKEKLKAIAKEYHLKVKEILG